MGSNAIIKINLYSNSNSCYTEIKNESTPISGSFSISTLWQCCDSNHEYVTGLLQP